MNDEYLALAIKKCFYKYILLNNVTIENVKILPDFIRIELY